MRERQRFFENYATENNFDVQNIECWLTEHKEKIFEFEVFYFFKKLIILYNKLFIIFIRKYKEYYRTIGIAWNERYLICFQKIIQNYFPGVCYLFFYSFL